MKYKTLCCNAENFIKRAKQAGLEVGMTPKPGAIMCWQKGATLSGSDGAGHVAICEIVYDNNHVLQYLSAHPINTQKRTSDTYDLYTKWCIQNGIKPKTSNEFGKELKKLGYESKRIQKANKRDFYYVKMT